MEPRRSSGRSLSPPNHQDRVDLRDDLVRIFATAVARLSDEHGQAIWKQLDVALTGHDVVLRGAVDGERMAPLVPCDPR
jgi:hypothetical protein